MIYYTYRGRTTERRKVTSDSDVGAEQRVGEMNSRSVESPVCMAVQSLPRTRVFQERILIYLHLE